MHRGSSNTTPQVILLLFLGSFVWARQLSDSYEKVRLFYPTGYYKRLPSYDFGLGKRSFEETSYEEQSSSPIDGASAAALLERDSSGILQSFPPGKRNRAYGFGLGKRQERRSKIYSFGLGKRNQDPEYFESDQQTVERRAPSQRQFAFGLGKRDSQHSTTTD